MRFLVVHFTVLILSAVIPWTTHAATSKISQQDQKYINRWVKAWNYPERDKWQKPQEVLRHLAIQPGMMVSEIGAGTGYFLPHLSQAVGKKGRVVAVDINAKFLHHLRTRVDTYPFKNVRVHEGKTDNPSLPAASLDRILMVNTWHHINNPAEYLKHLNSLLKPGGRIVIIDYEKKQPWDKQGKHFYTPERLKEDLSKSAAKLTIVLPEEQLPRQFVAILEQKN